MRLSNLINKKIGFIAGVFDMCHEGHIYLLKSAREYCDYLFVAVNDDEYVRFKKGRNPVNDQFARIEALYNTGLVHEVVPFHSDPLTSIEALKPDFIFCGSDYKPEQVTGYEECKKWGGQVIIIERIPGISTTDLIAKKENEELMSVFQGKILIGQKL
jgi:rfaE bifunctional protein nucleotidyltransferase chain/domain